MKFGAKTIEVATFRRQVDASTPEVELAEVLPGDAFGPEEQTAGDAERHEFDRRRRDRLIQRDNTYGTPE